MVATLRLAAATEDFGTPLKQAVLDAAKCGVQGLRLNVRSEIPPGTFSDTALRQLRLLIGERQMRVAGLMFPSRRSLYDEANLERRIQSIRAAMQQVQKLGTTELLVRCGAIPNPDATDTSGNEGSAGQSNSNVDSLANPFSFAPSSATGRPPIAPAPDKQFRMLVEILDDLTRYGNHVGCNLQLQLASFNVVRIQRLMTSVTGGPLSVVFDPATAVMTGANPVQVFRDIYQHTGYVRARDAVKDVDGAGIEVAPGDGVVDWMELLPTFSEADYSGWICVERSGGDQRAADVRAGVEHICNLITQF